MHSNSATRGLAVIGATTASKGRQAPARRGVRASADSATSVPRFWEPADGAGRLQRTKPQRSHVQTARPSSVRPCFSSSMCSRCRPAPPALVMMSRLLVLARDSQRSAPVFCRSVSRTGCAVTPGPQALGRFDSDRAGQIFEDGGSSLRFAPARAHIARPSPSSTRSRPLASAWPTSTPPPTRQVGRPRLRPALGAPCSCEHEAAAPASGPRQRILRARQDHGRHRSAPPTRARLDLSVLLDVWQHANHAGGSADDCHWASCSRLSHAVDARIFFLP